MNDYDAHMVALRDKVGEIARLIPRDKAVAFLDYPVYLNVGDLLIAKGTRAFFRNFGYRVAVTRSAYDFDPATLAPDTTIVLQGGGNFGDLYELHQAFRQQVIARFPNHRIVLLPQTIHFESPHRLAECVTVFAGHPDLHVAVRDRKSYALFRRNFPNPVYLFPDMAHFLWDEMAPQRRNVTQGSTLLFLRADKEEAPLAVGTTAGRPAIDWRDIISPADRVAFRILHRLHLRHGELLPRHEIHPLWWLYADRLIRKGVRTLAPHGRVTTNRLHMALLGLLMGREVGMADNSYGKLSAYYDCWLEKMPGVSLLGAAQPQQPRPSLASAAI